eukprot:2765462-Alexandrium_andersonii.AAC.1
MGRPRPCPPSSGHSLLPCLAWPRPEQLPSCGSVGLRALLAPLQEVAVQLPSGEQLGLLHL